ncbi:GNAT family N-acetyltransferase [Nocardioides convexus]|uniref:GNAT family N-acetyltransferase n=1 Tax=Nocardioides convexus TaxID=2712224 RepID=UPI00241846DF|nr:GNAT family N-acetyltransferase [Nocardioides convexus]
MHVLVAPPEGQPVPGLTTAVFDAVMAFCFADPAVRRVVVEPDVRNAPIRAKNLAAGFTEPARDPTARQDRDALGLLPRGLARPGPRGRRPGGARTGSR